MNVAESHKIFPVICKNLQCGKLFDIFCYFCNIISNQWRLQDLQDWGCIPGAPLEPPMVLELTRQHSSGMHATHLPTVRVLVVTTRCQYQWGWSWG